MRIGPFLVASLAGGILLFLLGFIIYGVLLGGMDPEAFPPEMGWKTEPDILMIFVSNLFSAMIVTLIAGAWGKAHTFQAGTIVGGITGALMSLAFGSSMLAFRTDSQVGVMLLDTGISFVMYGVMGGVIALVLARMQKT